MKRESFLASKLLRHVVLSLAFTVSAAAVCADNRPDFASFKDVKQKKKAFFDYMNAFVVAENKKILAERKTLLSEKPGSSALKSLCEKYSRDCDNIDEAKMTELKARIHVIPPSLALAQSANESAWGTSRFALKGYNYFGQWCYKKGCGIVPAKRNSGAAHEVRKFKDGQASVRAYLFNLNTGRAYKTLRAVRAKAVELGKEPSGLELATGLVNYSERREAYVEELQSMIRYNKLVESYDKPFWSQVGM